MNKFFLFFVFFFLFSLIIFLIIFQKNIINRLGDVFKPKPGYCLILEEKNCKKVKIIDFNGAKIAVGNLPPGSILFSPTNGFYSDTIFYSLNSDSKDFGLTINSLSNSIEESYVFIDSNKVTANFDQSITKKINKGDQIKKIYNKTLKFLPEYNLIFYITKKDPELGINPNNDLLFELFNLR